jgi:hypothetical protein
MLDGIKLGPSDSWRNITWIKKEELYDADEQSIFPSLFTPFALPLTTFNNPYNDL